VGAYPRTGPEEEIPLTRQVLLADDEPDMRLLVRTRLTRAGWDVVAVDDGPGVLSALGGGTFDAVVLDHRMPGVSGLEVARRLREDGFAHPIVILSAYLDPRIENEAEALGVRTLAKADVRELAAMIDDGPGDAA
jgi:CheY-like chemotaxis protein